MFSVNWESEYNYEERNSINKRKDFILQAKDSANRINLGNDSKYTINYIKKFDSDYDCLKHINSYYWKEQYPKEKQPRSVAWSED